MIFSHFLNLIAWSQLCHTKFYQVRFVLSLNPNTAPLLCTVLLIIVFFFFFNTISLVFLPSLYTIKKKLWISFTLLHMTLLTRDYCYIILLYYSYVLCYAHIISYLWHIQCTVLHKFFTVLCFYDFVTYCMMLTRDRQSAVIAQLIISFSPFLFCLSCRMQCL